MSFVQRVLEDPVALGTWVLALSTLLLALGTMVMVAIQTTTLRHTLRTDALSRLTALWDSSAMRTRRRQVARWLLSVNRSDDATFDDPRNAEVADFFEDVGALLRKKRLEFDLVWQAFSEDAVGWWVAIAEGFVESARRDGDPGTYSEYEYLVGRLVREDSRRAPMFKGWSQDNIEQFLEAERDLLLDEPSQVRLVGEQ
jgi:hypothetical protein